MVTDMFLHEECNAKWIKKGYVNAMELLKYQITIYHQRDIGYSEKDIQHKIKLKCNIVSNKSRPANIDEKLIYRAFKVILYIVNV